MLAHYPRHGGRAGRAVDGAAVRFRALRRVSIAALAATPTMPAWWRVTGSSGSRACRSTRLPGNSATARCRSIPARWRFHFCNRARPPTWAGVAARRPRGQQACPSTPTSTIDTSRHHHADPGLVETGVASDQGFTCQLAALAALAICGYARGVGPRATSNSWCADRSAQT